VVRRTAGDAGRRYARTRRIEQRRRRQVAAIAFGLRPSHQYAGCAARESADTVAGAVDPRRPSYRQRCRGPAWQRDRSRDRRAGLSLRRPATRAGFTSDAVDSSGCPAGVSGYAAVHFTRDGLARRSNHGPISSGSSWSAPASVCRSRRPRLPGTNAFRASCWYTAPQTTALWLEANIARRMDRTWLHPTLATILHWVAYGPVFDTRKRVADVAPRPVLIVGARDDERTPAGQTEQLFEAAGEPKKLRWTDGQHIEPGRTEIIQGTAVDRRRGIVVARIVNESRPKKSAGKAGTSTVTEGLTLTRNSWTGSRRIDDRASRTASKTQNVLLYLPHRG
jgi:hypothetical protein